MAQLTEGDRQEINAEAQRYWSAASAILGLTKAQLKAAVDATDVWIDDNASAYNTALPVAARTALNADQKTLLFCAVALRRAGLNLL